jgi:hypothetical protein
MEWHVPFAMVPSVVVRKRTLPVTAVSAHFSIAKNAVFNTRMRPKSIARKPGMQALP